MADDLEDAPWAVKPVQDKQPDLPDAPWHEPESQDAAPVTAEGAVKQLGVGAAKGAIGFIGGMGDIREFGGRAAEKLGFDPELGRSIAGGLNPLGPLANKIMPTSEEIQKDVEDYTGKFREPQNTLEKYTDVTGQFLGNPASWVGPGGVIQKGISAVGGALGSEGLGQLTNGTPIEPYARMLGGIFGGTALAGRGPQAKSITSELLHDSAVDNYTKARSFGVQIDPRDVANLQNNIHFKLAGDGYHTPVDTPKVADALDRLTERGGATATFDDIERTRSRLGQIAVNNVGESDAAYKARKMIDDYMENIDKNPNVLAGDAKKAAQAMRDARSDYAASKRVEQVENAIKTGEWNAATAGKGTNIDNTTRQAMKSVAKKIELTGKLPGYTDEETAQIRKAMMGTTTGNIARTIGMFAPTGIYSTGADLAMILGASLYGLGAAGFAIPAIGYAAKKLSDASTVRQAQKAADLVAERSNLAQSKPPKGYVLTPRQAAAARAAIVTPETQSQFKKGGPIARLERSRKRIGSLS